MTRARDIASGADFSTGMDAGEVLPHIIPGVLYPAVADKMVDGTTSLSASTTGPNSSTVTSSKYGTVQSDGRMYYYTDIKGSKPIKDPRIGAHFGSQRHKFKSLQLLEQETATHGSNVYSIDGREWVRACGDKWVMLNNAHGNFLENSTSSMADDNHFIEIVGYFNDANVLHWPSGTNNDQFGIAINGGTRQNNDLAVSVASPLNNRYVDAGSVVNVTFNATPTLGINTLRISNTNGAYYSNYGVELIAQDTSSTANKSKIQIPSQNVVSYGKKFTVSGTPHYDPFNGFTNETDNHNTYIDYATSLGTDGWKNGSNYYRPYNGGRVVKWVASDGTIKTSVNMMPPNAQNIAGTAISAKANASVANNTYLPTFSGAIDHSLSEVAKTFHWREFGNGAVNGGTERAYWADASMLSGAADDIAYVMDDGLTSLGADDYYLNNAYGLIRNATGKDAFITFIGTGIAIDGHDGTNDTAPKTVVQNLPYGTHIFKIEVNDSSTSTGKWYVDGVEVKDWDASTGNNIYEQGPRADISFHQPKKPPIPEDAVVLADYMLMADFVKQTAKSNGTEISKGVRALSATRDVFYDSSAAFNATPAVEVWVAPPFGFNGVRAGTATMTAKLHFFGTDVVAGIANSEQSHTVTFPGTTANTKTAIGAGANAGGDTGDLYTLADSATLGNNEVISTILNGGYNFTQYHLASPIHTSFHYQTFETPYLHELVGGDRNMEQTNLVVTPDGKTWDEVTRDTSYIGPRVEMHCAREGGHVTAGNIWFGDYWRGLEDGKDHYNKGIAIAYDRIIILEDGYYEVSYQNYFHGDSGVVTILKNNTTGGQDNGRLMRRTSSDDTVHGMRRWHCKRGDYITVRVDYGTGNVADGSSVGYNEFRIIKIG